MTSWHTSWPIITGSMIGCCRQWHHSMGGTKNHTSFRILSGHAPSAPRSDHGARLGHDRAACRRSCLNSSYRWGEQVRAGKKVGPSQKMLANCNHARFDVAANGGSCWNLRFSWNIFMKTLYMYWFDSISRNVQTIGQPVPIESHPIVF